MKKALNFIIILWSISFSYSQTTHDSVFVNKNTETNLDYIKRNKFPNNLESYGWSLNVGYSYMNTHTGYVGLNYLNINFPLIVGLGAYLGSFNQSFKPVPALNLSFPALLGVFTIVSTQHINPGIQINMFNFYWIHIGYSWSWNNSTNIKGITFGINLFFNLKGDFRRPV